MSPYGELVSGSATDRLLFTQHERDTENGSDSALYRQYASTQGRWLSADPYNGSYDLTDPQSLNRYAYLSGRPLDSADSLGLDDGCVDPCPRESLSSINLRRLFAHLFFCGRSIVGAPLRPICFRQCTSRVSNRPFSPYSPFSAHFALKGRNTPVRLKNGAGTGYGLGVNLGERDGHKTIEHSGEVSAFVSDNLVFPNDRAAVIVLSNEMATQGTQAARQIADQSHR